jgi:hypothetical protein
MFETARSLAQSVSANATFRKFICQGGGFAFSDSGPSWPLPSAPLALRYAYEIACILREA